MIREHEKQKTSKSNIKVENEHLKGENQRQMRQYLGYIERSLDAYPKNKNKFIEHEKNIIRVNGYYVKEQGDFHLFNFINRHGVRYTEHMWVRKPNISENVSIGDLCGIEGVVHYYTKEKDGTIIKSYGLLNAKVTRFKYDK